MPKTKASAAKQAKRATKLPKIKLLDYYYPEDYQELRQKPRCLRPISASENPCNECPGHCCELLLSLSVHDIARISINLAISPAEFCHFEKRDDSWNQPPIDIEGELHYLMLNSGEGKPCTFLHKISTERRCAIYELRPMTCRLYPFRWGQDNMISGPKIIWCPQTWLISKANRRRITALIRRSLVEEAESHRAMKAFNRQKTFPHTYEGFFRYVLVKGGELLGLDPKPVLDKFEDRRLGNRLW